MKFGTMNKLTIVNSFFLHTLHCSIVRLAIITRKTAGKLDFLKGGGKWKRADILNYSSNF